jgi:hypothetical protein
MAGSTEQQPSRFKRFVRFFSKSEWVNVFLTAVIAVTGVVGIFLVIQGGEDTRRIRDAAEKQAQAAGDFADTASRINSGINDAVSRLDIQAGAEKTSAEATEKIASANETSARVSQAALQPAIAFDITTTKVSDNSLSYEIKITNEGGSTAMVTMRTCSIFDPQLKSDVSVDNCKTASRATEIRTDGPIAVLPHRDNTIGVSQPNFAPAKSGQFYLYTPHELSYTFAKTRYTQARCFVYDKFMDALNECGVAMRNQSFQTK